MGGRFHSLSSRLLHSYHIWMSVSPETLAKYEAVIGLEVHVQLATRTKIFCACPTGFGAPPNTNVCPVCLGLPGALPVLNRHAVEMAIQAALGAELPGPRVLRLRAQELLLSGPAQGLPDLAVRQAAGRARLRRHRSRTATRKRIGVTRVHMEDDAGKSIHDGFQRFRPLHLCRPEPLRHAADRNRQRARHAQRRRSLRLPHRAEAGACSSSTSPPATWRKATCAATPTSRCACKGAEKFGTKAEVKNLNSFRFLKLAIDYEIERQIELSKAAAAWCRKRASSIPTPAKPSACAARKHAHDYRYFPEPDLVPLRISEAWLSRDPVHHAGTAARQARAVHRANTACASTTPQVLTQSRELSEYFERRGEGLGRRRQAGGQLGHGRSGGRAQGRRQGDRRVARRAPTSWANW